MSARRPPLDRLAGLGRQAANGRARFGRAGVAFAAIAVALGAFLGGAGFGTAFAAPPALIRLDEPAPAQAEADVDALFALTQAETFDSIDDLEARLKTAFDAAPTALVKATAFGRAARVAAQKGDRARAFAFSDWALREAGEAGEPGLDLAVQLAREAIDLAVEAGDPVQARSFARAQGAIEADWIDRRLDRAVTFKDHPLVCPDVTADRFIRFEIVRDKTFVGEPPVSPVKCRYRSILKDETTTLELSATRSYADPEARIRGAVEVGLDAADAAERRALMKRLPQIVSEAGVERLGEDPIWLGATRHTRPGSDGVAAYAYGLWLNDGVLIATRAAAPVRDWPPQGLLDLARTGLDDARRTPVADTEAPSTEN